MHWVYYIWHYYDICHENYFAYKKCIKINCLLKLSLEHDGSEYRGFLSGVIVVLVLKLGTVKIWNRINDYSLYTFKYW